MLSTFTYKGIEYAPQELQAQIKKRIYSPFSPKVGERVYGDCYTDTGEERLVRTSPVVEVHRLMWAVEGDELERWVLVVTQSGSVYAVGVLRQS